VCCAYRGAAGVVLRTGRGIAGDVRFGMET